MKTKKKEHTPSRFTRGEKITGKHHRPQETQEQSEEIRGVREEKPGDKRAHSTDWPMG